MPSTWPTPRVWTAGERVSASKMNEISTALGILFPHTAAGDLAYRDAAGAYLTRLAHVAGGIFYGGPSAPAWLVKPAANSFLRNGTSGVPDWVATDNIPGLLNAKNTVTFAPGQTFASTWADITGATINLTLTRTCTIVVRAIVTGYNQNAGPGRGFYYRSVVNGTADPSSSQPFEGSQTEVINRSLAYDYYATGVTAGTRTVKLQCQADTDPNIVTRGILTALAFVE